MRKALQIFTEHVYEVLALIVYKVFLLGMLFMFSIGVFVVANTFIKLPIELGLILFGVLAKGTLLSFFKQLYLLIGGKRISLDDFTFYGFLFSIRALPIMVAEVVLLFIILIPLILLVIYLPETLENVIIVAIYALYLLFAMFIVGYIVIWPYLWTSILDTNPIVALKEGIRFALKNVDMIRPYGVWFLSFLSIFVPLLNLLTYFTVYPASTINLLLSFRSLNLGRRLPL